MNISVRALAAHKDGFAGQVALLAGSTIIGQGIVVLASPVISRLYRPERHSVRNRRNETSLTGRG